MTGPRLTRELARLERQRVLRDAEYRRRLKPWATAVQFVVWGALIVGVSVAVMVIGVDPVPAPQRDPFEVRNGEP